MFPHRDVEYDCCMVSAGFFPSWKASLIKSAMKSRGEQLTAQVMQDWTWQRSCEFDWCPTSWKLPALPLRLPSLSLGPASKQKKMCQASFRICQTFTSDGDCDTAPEPRQTRVKHQTSLWKLSSTEMVNTRQLNNWDRELRTCEQETVAPNNSRHAVLSQGLESRALTSLLVTNAKTAPWASNFSEVKTSSCEI